MIRTAGRLHRHSTILMVGMALCVLVAGSVWAERVRLKDGTEVSATRVHTDRERVLLELPRDAVASIDGKALPLPVAVGTAAPAFTATDLRGVTHSQTDSNGRPTLLQFWASWCPYCRRDLDMMKALFETHHGKTARILSVSTDQDMAALAQFVEQQHMPFPVIAGYGPSAVTSPPLPDLYEIDGIPAYFLISGTGTIVKTWAGTISNAREEVEQAIQTLGTAPRKR